MLHFHLRASVHIELLMTRHQSQAVSCPSNLSVFGLRPRIKYVEASQEVTTWSLPKLEDLRVRKGYSILARSMAPFPNAGTSAVHLVWDHRTTWQKSVHVELNGDRPRATISQRQGSTNIATASFQLCMTMRRSLPVTGASTHYCSTMSRTVGLSFDVRSFS
jgi:hypothetical protein